MPEILTTRPESVQFMASETPLDMVLASAEPSAAIESKTASIPETVPDIQLHFAPLLYADHGRDLKMAMSRYGYAVMIYKLRPLSRGQVGLRSKDPLAAPRIDPNYLADAYDQRMIVAGLRLNRAVAAQPAVAALVEQELAPGAPVDSDEALLAYARANGGTTFHQCASCAMGGAPTSALDPSLRVRGLDALRVADASVMPSVPSANTNAPTIMIAEKASDMIRAAARL